MRNLKIRQLLLLFLRTLIMFLLALAFARPTLGSGDGLLSDRSQIEAVIILDNTLSLNEAKLTGSLLEQLRQTLKTVEPVFRSGDRITVLQSSYPVQILIDSEVLQADTWERVYQKLQSNALKSDLDAAFSRAIEVLRRSPLAGREIYMISDFQKFSFDPAQAQQQLERAGLESVKVYCLPVLHAGVENISIDSLTIVNRLIEKRQNLRLRARFFNHHPSKQLNTFASVILNGNRVAQQNIALPPSQPAEVLFNVTLPEDGHVAGVIEIENDANPEDNRYHFNFYVPRKIRVLHLAADDRDDAFLPSIIRPAVEEGIFEYTRIASAGWAARNFSDYEVIILDGLSQVPETLLQRLKNVLERGNGVVAIPGTQSVPRSYQELTRILQVGDFLTPYGRPGAEAFLSIGAVDWQHPVLEGMFEDNHPNLAEIAFYSGYKIRPGAQAKVIMRLSDRTPLLIQGNHATGSAFLLTSPLDLQWSQLPLKGLVVPLMYRAIYYAGSKQLQERLQVRTGQPLQIGYSRLPAPYEFRVIGIDGETKLTPQFNGSDIQLSVEDTGVPGNYQLWHNQRQLGIYSVNHWAQSSRTSAYDVDEIIDRIPGAIAVTGESSPPEIVQEQRLGRELWRPLLVFALLLLFVEMMVARTTSKSVQVSEESV